ncbi:hypothetical protein GCM10009610_66690 [Pseudonocardia xinjiangensis]
MLAELGALDDGGPLVEQVDDRAQEAGLALTALAQQHDVVTCEEGTFQLREHGGLEPDDPGPCVAPLAERGEEVLADLVLDTTDLVAGRPEGTEGAGKIMGHVINVTPRARGLARRPLPDATVDLYPA